MEQQNTPRQPESNKKNRFNRCSFQLRNLSLELFRLPSDGRKWQQSARSRYGLLSTLARYANPDGTVGGGKGENFVPAVKKLLRQEHIAEKTFYRVTNALRELGWLSWTREKTYHARRIYQIHLPTKRHLSYSAKEHLSYSVKSPVTTTGESPVTTTGVNTRHIGGQNQQNNAVKPSVQYYKPPLESFPPSRLPSEIVSVAAEFSPNTEPSRAAAKAFSAFGFRSPFGHQQFRNAVVRSAKKISKGNILEVMEAVIVELHQIVPPQWYDAKHKLEVAKPAFDHRKLKQL